MNTTTLASRTARALPARPLRARPSGPASTRFARAYRKALRLAEYQAWQQLEPREHLPTPAPELQRSRLERLCCLGAGMVIATAAILALGKAFPLLADLASTWPR